MLKARLTPVEKVFPVNIILDNCAQKWSLFLKICGPLSKTGQIFFFPLFLWPERGKRGKKEKLYSCLGCGQKKSHHSSLNLALSPSQFVWNTFVFPNHMLALFDFYAMYYKSNHFWKPCWCCTHFTVQVSSSWGNLNPDLNMTNVLWVHWFSRWEGQDWLDQTPSKMLTWETDWS